MSESFTDPLGLPRGSSRAGASSAVREDLERRRRSLERRLMPLLDELAAVLDELDALPGAREDGNPGHRRRRIQEPGIRGARPPRRQLRRALDARRH